MTVSTSNNSVVYRGNGAATQFAVPFKVLDEDHLVVTRRDYTTGELDYTYVGTDYSYTGIGAASGTLTLSGPALDDDYELVIERIVPYTQDLDIVNAGGFYPETVEEQLDLIVMGVQQIAEVVDRAIVVPVGETVVHLPKGAERAGKFLAFDAGGEPTATTGTGADGALREDLADADAGAALVAFQSTLNGLVAKTLEAKAAESVSVLEGHALAGTGNVLYDSAALTAVVAAIPEGGVIKCPPGSELYFEEVDVSDKRFTLDATGATIICSGTAGLIKEDHGKKLSIEGGIWTGTRALHYEVDTSETQYVDFSISNAFFQTEGYALYFDGPREGVVFNCDFEGDWDGSSATLSCGVFRVRTANTTFIACDWKNCEYAINDDGDGSAYSAGLMVVGGHMLGCGTGVYSSLTDFVSLIGLMCDYNDVPVRFEAVDGGEIRGGAYSSRTTAPPIYIGPDADTGAIPSIGIDVNPCLVIAHSADPCDGVQVVFSNKVRVHPTKIEGFRRYGVRFDDCTNLSIYDTFFACSGAAAGRRGVFEEVGSTSSNSNRIYDNDFSDPSGTNAIEVGGNTAIAHNSGYSTQTHLTGTITSGNQTQTIAHGLPWTPSVQDCIAFPTNDEAASKNVYVSAADATNVTIRTTAATAADATAGVKIRKREVTV